jgi:hypothetical protein
MLLIVSRLENHIIIKAELGEGNGTGKSGPSAGEEYPNEPGKGPPAATAVCHCKCLLQAWGCAVLLRHACYWTL